MLLVLRREFTQNSCHLPCY